MKQPLSLLLPRWPQRLALPPFPPANSGLSEKSETCPTAR